MRVHIGIALMVLMLVLTLAGTAPGQEKDRNGYWWVNQTQEFRSGFVLGYAMAMGVNSDAAWMKCVEAKRGGADVKKASVEEWQACMETPEVVRLSYSGIRPSQLVEGVDEFYKDFRNKNIVVELAMRYVKDELRRMTDKELQDELSDFRKTANK
jgi:hypothetical protein